MKGKGIWEMLTFWVRISNRYDRILSSGKADRSVWLAVQSILYSVLGNAVVVGCIWFATLLIAQEDLFVLFGIMIAVILALAAVIALYRGILAALVCLIYQFRLNRGPMSWIALVVFLLSIIAAVVVSFWVLGFFGGLMN